MPPGVHGTEPGMPKARGARAVDLLIAATAMAAGLTLYTRNGDDFRTLGGLLEVIEL